MGGRYGYHDSQSTLSDSPSRIGDTVGTTSSGEKIIIVGSYKGFKIIKPIGSGSSSLPRNAKPGSKFIMVNNESKFKGIGLYNKSGRIAMQIDRPHPNEKGPGQNWHYHLWSQRGEKMIKSKSIPLNIHMTKLKDNILLKYDNRIRR